jgi:3'-5' exonuclease
MNFHKKDIYNTLFIDIETVSAFKTFDELPETLKPLWIRKAKSLDQSLNVSDSDAVNRSYTQRAAIYAEFGRIICISIGFITASHQLRLKSIYGHNEYELLCSVRSILEDYYNDMSKHFIAGHNIREFDIPYLCRRMLINSVALPSIFNIMSKKPWQTEHLVDTLEMWKFGDNKSFISLNLLCAVLGIESPKSDLDGSLVGHAYYEEDRLEDISSYCTKDVIAVAKIVARLTNYLDPEEIIPYIIEKKDTEEEE